MAESIYNSVKKFSDLKSVISTKNELKTSTNKSSCENYRTRRLKGYTDKNDVFLNTCTKIADNQKEILEEATSSKLNFCKYMNYLFYDMLNTMKPFHYYVLLNQFYSEIEKFWDCLEHMEDIDINTYEKLKILYELYDDFIEFKKESYTENAKSCEHGAKCVQLYTTHSKKCKDNYNNKFCMILIDFRKEYEDYKTKVKKCGDSMQYLEPIISDSSSPFLVSTAAMSAISVALFVSYKFTPFGAWLRPRLPGGKKKANIVDHKMSELPKNSKTEGTSYKVPYHSS
ncbi:VIR protein [Plasmodium vivax]|uniref:VIR protein n=1 Tax=Plasmodium vivax TaxID=5855 RepID=A0A1G4E9D3_PLAVI|nr:VIR protein [Plasmodium vivax]